LGWPELASRLAHSGSCEKEKAMATVFKRPGKPNWFISWFEPTARGNKRKTKSSGTTCKRTSQRIANEIEAKAALKRSGIIDVVADEIAQQSGRSIEEHISDFTAKLKAAGRSTGHIDDTKRKIRSIAEFAGFQTVGDIDGDGVNRFANHIKDKGRSARTIGSYLVAIKSLCKWLTENRKLARDPLAGLKKPNPESDRRLQRRCLSPEEWRHVQSVTQFGPTRHHMTANERALLYELAIVTGLRSGELRTLKRASLDLSNEPVVICDAGDTKNKKIARQHIPGGLAERLRTHVSAKSLNAVVFNLPHETKLSRMFRCDLSEARKRWLSEAVSDPDEYARRDRSDFLKPKDSKGKSLDFHALRHTCGAWLMMAGVDIKTVQAVMRHSVITLTLDTYGHLMPDAELQAVANVDAMMSAITEGLTATGTDFQVQHRVQQLEHETLRIGATDCEAENRRTALDCRSHDSNGSPQVISLASVSEALRDNAIKSGNGWESNPPSLVSEATTDLKSAAVTRSAYAPGSVDL
jgi:integrase